MGKKLRLNVHNFKGSYAVVSGYPLVNVYITIENGDVQ